MEEKDCLNKRVLEILENFNQRRARDIQSYEQKKEMCRLLDIEIETIYSKRKSYELDEQLWIQLVELYLDLGKEMLEIHNQNRNRY